jgi:hypothetical protein
MKDNKIKELSKYRLSDAKEKLKSAEILFEKSQYKDSVSRSYYAMFSGARALLALRELNNSKHSGIISLFNQHFVKNGIVNKSCGRILLDAKEIREEGDYGDFYVIRKEEAETQLKNAKKFMKEIENVLKVKWKIF